MIRVLFVCMGNICRSPAAEAVFVQKTIAAGLGEQIQCDSAGTIDYHAGAPADTRMRRADQRRGYDLTSISRGFLLADFEQFDWIVTMDEENYRNILALARTDADRKKIVRFCNWVDLPGIDEVPDPYYGGNRGFDDVLDILENGSDDLLQWMTKENERAD